MMRRSCEIIDVGSHLEIPTKNGRVLLDHEDRQMVETRPVWTEPSRSGPYAYVRKDGKCVRLHRLILAAPAPLLVDHRDRNTLDNRRANLRLATTSQNCANCRMMAHNASGYRGVDFDRGRWRARVRHNKIQRFIGLFATAEAAARAYDAAATERHGEFAALNFPSASVASLDAAPVAVAS